MEASNVLARLEPEAVFPALEATARGEEIPLRGIDAPDPAARLEVGDSVTALLTLHEKKNRRTQWLLCLKVIPTPVLKSSAGEPMIFYTSTGHRFEFEPSLAWLRVQSIGPCPEPKAGEDPAKLKVRSVDISVNKGFLGVGFDQGAASIVRRSGMARAAGRTNLDFHFGVKDQPFDRATILRESTKAAALLVTTNEERSLVGWIPATISYFETTMNCPDLESILRKLVKLPSVWSMIKGRGVAVSLAFDTENVGSYGVESWRIPSAPAAYAVPWTAALNGQPGLNVTMIVTSPQPPLLTCAGIVGMLVETPGNQDKYLTLRVISARAGGAKR